MVYSCLSGRPKMWATAMLQQYIGFNTRLTCVHVERVQPTPSTAPPLLCETHPAQTPSMCFPFPTKQTLHQPHRLPLVRPVILSWVKPFLYASGKKVVWLDWLTPMMKQRCERHAIISVVLEASRRFSACVLLHRIKF